MLYVLLLYCRTQVEGQNHHGEYAIDSMVEERSGGQTRNNEERNHRDRNGPWKATGGNRSRVLVRVQSVAWRIDEAFGWPHT